VERATELEQGHYLIRSQPAHPNSYSSVVISFPFLS
jgi:hypothetical protein